MDLEAFNAITGFLTRFLEHNDGYMRDLQLIQSDTPESHTLLSIDDAETESQMTAVACFPSDELRIYNESFDQSFEIRIRRTDIIRILWAKGDPAIDPESIDSYQLLIVIKLKNNLNVAMNLGIAFREEFEELKDLSNKYPQWLLFKIS